jgi:hypothetical protein
MSLLPYPVLVITRKYASNGKPWWSCEMRFAEDDVEQRDAGNVPCEEAVASCAPVWGIKKWAERDPDINVYGQRFYSVWFENDE